MANTLYDFYTGQGQKLPSVQERAKIYESSGLGSANTYQGTAQQNTALLGALQKLPSTIKAEDIGSSPTPVIPPTSNIDKTSNLMSGINAMQTQAQADALAKQTAEIERLKAGIDTYNNSQMIQGTDPNQTTRTKLITGLNDLYDKRAESKKALGEAYKSGGVADYQRRLDELNLQSAQLQGSYLQGVTNAEGQTIPMQFITGQQAQMQRQYAIKAASIALEQQAIQGNITNAKQIAQEMIDLEYGDIETQIAQQKDLINLNYQDLTTSEKKRADALNYALGQEQARINEEKQTKTDISNIMIKAAENGADQATLDKIRKATTVFDAISATGSYLSTQTATGNYSIVDVNGESMIFDKDLGTLTPTTSSTSETYFTDANGINWNLEGWAVDPTKASQMQSISDKIGKVTDENIDAKVAQFTPGLTADMIRETSAKTGVSWEALMAMVNQESTGGTSNVARNNNNYAGLTWSENTQWKQPPYNGTKGTARPSAEGGNYIKFPTPQAGLDAMGALMAQKGTVIPKEQQIDSDVQNLLQLVKDKKYTDKQAIDEMKTIDKTKVSSLINELAKIAPGIDEQSKFLATRAEYLQKHEGLDESVGYGLGRKALSPLNWAKKDDFIGKVQQMVDILTLNKLIEVKGQGATFGALSDSERAVIERAATPINQWVVKDKNGVVTGYKISESKFKEELKRIEAEYKKQAVNSLTDNIKMMSDGTTWELQPDGTYTQIT